MIGLVAPLFLACSGLCAEASAEREQPLLLAEQQAGPGNPFLSKPESNEPRTRTEDAGPFGGSSQPGLSVPTDCGASSGLGRADLRKPHVAEALCAGAFHDLDDEWLFVLNYVRGFNEFLEERGSFLDPTGACSRAVEPRASLGLVYSVVDRAMSGDLSGFEDDRLTAMLKPFQEDWKRLPFIVWELNVWKREGRLDATSVASKGMCADPAFLLFWDKAIEYVQRVPVVD